MVRVCSHEKCSRPHHVFGCVFYTGNAVTCDDCKQFKPGVYQQCAIRTIEPSPEDSIEGLCDSCARLIIRSMEHSNRNRQGAGTYLAAPF